MKAYLLKTGLTIEPFQDPVGAAYLGGESMKSAVERAFGQADVSVEYADTTDDVPLKGDYLLLPDTLFITRRTVRAFLSNSTGNHRLALVRGPATEYARPLQQVVEDEAAVAYDLFRLRDIELPRGLDWTAAREFLSERTEMTVLDPEARVEFLPQMFPGQPQVSLPRTTMLAADLRHWVHILWLNHQLPWVRLQEYWEDHPGLRRAWRSRGKNPHRQAMRRSVIGRGCDIHPTARVEGSLVGDRVKLGPHVSIRDCIVGDEVEVSSHTKFLRCIVGQECHTLNDSYFIGCTFYPGSTLANFIIRNSILGRDNFLTSGAMFWSEVTNDSVRVRQADQEIATGRCDLGGCTGHGCLLGARAIFLAGRSVPNRTVIVMRPGEGVFKMPAGVDAEQPYICHQGAAVPLEQAFRDYRPGELE